ncbi:hypothetical protein MSG28_000539 [Choristoneura fumiferana]|uniref:Uncharacterized protein n=1 Tax=Choristoneura fumiferana TaxID=7141 RepID=A0ACC0K164_CHOFU|nr:hypothetical protein MSG28_000539 [Choristoneura fumiferana]
MLDAQSLRRVRPGCAMPQVVPRVPAPAPYRPYDKISNRNRYECNLEEIISKLVNALIYTVLRKDGSGAGGGNGGAGGGSGGGAGGGSGSGAGGGSGGGAGGGSGGGAGGGNGSGGGAEKTDLSRLRGKEAAAELKRSKQQKLDEQKKTLDRKIQAREAANIISREKSTTAASKLSTKSSTNKLSEVSKSDGKIETAHKSSSEISGDNAGDKVVTRNDMGTQWDTEILPLEWEPNIPALPIPKDDSNKESMCIDTENNTEKKKRPNLFALSDEMPSSLRGSCYPIIINEPAKPSLTLVSEYIQNRALRLRETPVSNSNKKNSADLQNLKQTILRTRSLRAEDTRDVPFADEQIVVRDMHSNKDAYIEALSEAASNTEEKQNKKLQDVSTKIAVTRQSVEKEYKDTMAFLNGLPKSKGLSTKPIKNAYKDDYRLNQQKENRQKILQQEFKNMEKEASQQRYSYSWMPVPESDGNLAVHTIPTNVKEGKSGNNVKFSKVDSYHEYRSRHKHTPPTKDTGSHDKKSNKRVVEAVIIQHKPDDSSSGSSIASDNSSAEDITFDSNLNKYIDDNKSNDQLTDAERIIIYKILDNKKRRNDKMPRKSKVNDVIQQNGIDKDKITKSTQNENVSKVEPPRLIAAAVANDQGPTPFDELGEGIYKIENEKQKIGVSHKCKCNNISRCKSYSPIIHPSTNTSAASFKTATNIKTNNKHQEDKYIKVIDEGMKEKGNFYIGATGFLKDDAYEVVIQLRKKDTNKEEVKKYEDDIVTREKPASDKEKNTKEVLISTTECVEDGNGKVTNGSTNCYTEPSDLTEKCTKRLSNLAKVLEEVRKNKSLAYSQISTSDSTDSDQKSDQAIIAANPEQQLPNLPVHVTGKNLEAAYESLLFGIPKPGYIESPLNTDSENEFSNNNNNEATPITPPLITTNVEYRNNNHPKYRTKPPPALLRMHLKRPEENVVPHELSTVIEVDSPLSVKLKNQSSNADNASQSNKHLTETRAEEKNDNLFADKEFQIPLAPSDSGFKIKSSNKQDMPTIVTDSVSSVPNLSNKPIPERHSDTSKNAQQQTSLTNSMTVKEFLNKELAKKITFTNKTVRNDSHAEFVSLIETKIPDELKNSLHTIIGEISGDSEPSANNNRARTSTPVQIFKSPTYHSSSSSNISNGLFSNADDLSSVKLTSTSMRYHSASEKDELTIPNFSLKMRKGVSDCTLSLNHMNSESTIGDGKRSATHVSPVLPTNHRFLEPERAVKTITDMAVWEKSEAYMEYTGFIATINEAIKGKPLSVDCKVNDNVKKLLHVLEEIGKYIEEFPPVEQPQRFGNTAFREWLEKVKCNTTILLQGMLELPLQLAIPEIKVYLEESFGNATRIDYGTGHEMSFVMFLCCLYKIGFLIPEDNVSTVFLVFNKYLNIARTLQKTYRMEPAGSHGVWSLDDYQFIPFIWGSAQLVDQPKIYPPVKFLDDDIIDKYANDYMFLSCIKYIKDVKKGPFAEHSNQLWSISAVSSWSKINQGLIKMYKKEVLSKFPVVQHVLFGSLLPIRRFPINH